ncbi:putative endoglucanase type K [Neonectria ditissima]|uniref:Cellulase n=1 Tax=Neonectria ditissima TaxID=78410 RepID=A0A0P7BDI1_9HYPO|nr:putative endoglucanase type K [Neonectria ditissima]
MRSSALYFALAGPIAVRAASGTGQSTRYWDCCKPSCAWNDKASVSAPVLTCDKNDNPISDANAVSGCDGGSSYTCSSYSPWAVSEDLAYGFAATAIDGGSESSWCCACYALTFTSGAAKGKKMVVQSTNTGGDLGSNHFDLLIPGGGVGIFDGCSSEFGSALPGAQYGGISSQSQCASFPEVLKDGCNWRFDWFDNSDNPGLTFEQVQCPTALTDISGCKRDDDSSFPVFSGGSAAASSVKSSTVVAQATKAATSSKAAATSSKAAAVSSKATVSSKAATSSKAAVVSKATTSKAAVQTVAPTTKKVTTSAKSSTRTRTRTKTGCAANKSSALKASSTSKAASTAVSAAPASASTAAIYHQCNGSKDLFPNGAIACAKGSTCVYSNDWYSQCQ